MLTERSFWQDILAVSLVGLYAIYIFLQFLENMFLKSSHSHWNFGIGFDVFQNINEEYILCFK